MAARQGRKATGALGGGCGSWSTASSTRGSAIAQGDTPYLIRTYAPRPQDQDENAHCREAQAPFRSFRQARIRYPNAARFVTMPEIEVTGQATGKTGRCAMSRAAAASAVPGWGDGRSPEWSAFPSLATGAPWRGSAGTAMRASAGCVVP